MRKTNKPTQWIILGVMTALLICCGQTKRQSFLYLEKVKDLGEIIINQASADMNLCNMYNTVWEYAKVTDLDFRSAYREMNLDTSDIAGQVDTNMEMMERMMNMVNSPPKNMTGIHDKLIELRELYMELNKFVLQMPQVSQEKFNSEVDAYIANVNSLKEELDSLIAEAEANL
ncbi:hypothetical protein ACFLRX_08085 [Acidobacteriota bacterium]